MQEEGERYGVANASGVNVNRGPQSKHARQARQECKQSARKTAECQRARAVRENKRQWARTSSSGTEQAEVQENKQQDRASSCGNHQPKRASSRQQPIKQPWILVARYPPAFLNRMALPATAPTAATSEVSSECGLEWQ